MNEENPNPDASQSTPPEAGNDAAQTSAPSTDAAPQKAAEADAFAKEFDKEFQKDDKVTFDRRPAVVTFSYDDETADVQIVDDEEKVVRDENGQPAYFPNVPFKQLTAR